MVVFYKVIVPMKSDHKKLLITLTVIISAAFTVVNKTECLIDLRAISLSIKFWNLVMIKEFLCKYLS